MTVELAEPAIGFREWRIRGEQLVALNGYRWLTGDVVAESRRDPAAATSRRNVTAAVAYTRCTGCPGGGACRRGSVIGAVLMSGRLELELEHALVEDRSRRSRMSGVSRCRSYSFVP